MKTRILSSAVAIVLVLAVLLFLPSIAVNIMMAALSLIAVYELTRALGLKSPGVLILSAFCAASAPFWLMIEYSYLLPISVILWYTLLMIVSAILFHEKLLVTRVGLMYMMTMLVSVGMASVAYLRAMEHGLFYVFVALLMAWASDTGAYFAGTFFGKHKLCPKISPKKTVEGLIGGLVSDVLICLLAGWIYTLIDPKATVHYLWLAGLALVGAGLSVFGDLFASIVKRKFGVKDYGSIMPGHGGVMDRFDSVLVVAPYLYWAMLIMPIVT